MKPPTNRRKRLLIITAIVLLLAVGGGVAYKLTASRQATDNKLPESSPSDTINTQPPTEEEKQEAEQNKDRIVDEANRPPAPTNAEGKKTVAPVIVDAGQYGSTIEVRAYEPGITESDGQCSYTFTRNGQTVSRQLPAIADATTTRCTNLKLERSAFPVAGEWQLSVTYNSAKTTGSSTSKVTVQ